MLSITSSTKSKPGTLNKIKSLLISDKSLWDFFKHDPKVLAYYLSAFQLMNNPKDYNISPKLIETVDNISGESYDEPDTNHEYMDYSEPINLLEIFGELETLSDETIQKIISEILNPEKINIKEVREVVTGLINYLKLQNIRNVLVKLEWF